MKFEIKTSKIRENYSKSHTFNVSDCENAVNHFFEPCAYNGGMYGWNYDFFKFNEILSGRFYNFCFVAGYRGFPASVRLPENIREYIEKAYKKSEKDFRFDWKKRVQYGKRVRKTFLEKIQNYLNAEDEKERAKQKAREEREAAKAAKTA